ncbi:NAD-dependent epimerase/dehydratase [Sulfurimonas gotlandica GD1]|uniref:NAD-dependent epimerase/dehydratase n=1 Tax=Sulfurimonas gotlandica (strain DSM 19862 / JCM 16533 / GD1) TaxID=929558 RepID=B6BIY0_SULGG|nr:SDR family oxidoreductase [Sulfurimonas gotlandica]EDZ62824.1 NAD dependent epimerase/dehydratase family protein [Sulfurimonas gotlandica GD1]EHP30491.1 NAD-dependent epimerase/dehydratase [Sulfurimonas gotlandica GD1]
MVLTIIIGKNSNLSTHLKNTIENTFLVSSSNIQALKAIDVKDYKKINIIFNQFQISTKLYELESPIDYINRSIVTTAEVLEYIKSNSIQINKIIYTSSSSVYGNNISCSESNETHPLSLHSSLKVANERLIEKFCSDNDIDYTITRVFNMYGGDDNFSVISKIINFYKKNETLTLVNNGEAIRDFIHIDDVVHSYIKILKTKNTPIINIGTAEGKSILYILNYLRKNSIELKTNEIFKKELMVSISENKILLKIIGNYSFKKVEEYILEKIKSENGIN